jgi:hypothetical protein
MNLKPTTVEGRYFYYRCANKGDNCWTLIRKVTVNERARSLLPLVFDEVTLIDDVKLPAYRLYDVVY